MSCCHLWHGVEHDVSSATLTSKPTSFPATACTSTTSATVTQPTFASASHPSSPYATPTQPATAQPRAPVTPAVTSPTFAPTTQPASADATAAQPAPSLAPSRPTHVRHCPAGSHAGAGIPGHPGQLDDRIQRLRGRPCMAGRDVHRGCGHVSGAGVPVSLRATPRDDAVCVHAPDAEPAWQCV